MNITKKLLHVFLSVVFLNCTTIPLSAANHFSQITQLMCGGFAGTAALASARYCKPCLRSCAQMFQQGWKSARELDFPQLCIDTTAATVLGAAGALAVASSMASGRIVYSVLQSQAAQQSLSLAAKSGGGVALCGTGVCLAASTGLWFKSAILSMKEHSNLFICTLSSAFAVLGGLGTSFCLYNGTHQINAGLPRN